MLVSNKKEKIILIFGDFIVLFLSLWATLFFRSGNFPSFSEIQNHFTPFFFLSLVWLLSFYIAGLYDKQRTVNQGKIPEVFIKTHFTNSLISIIFFYFIPFFGVTPKTILFIHVAISGFLLYFWRMNSKKLISTRKKINTVIIGKGKMLQELFEEVNGNDKYPIYFVSKIDVDEKKLDEIENSISNLIKEKKIGLVVFDSKEESLEPILAKFYNLIFSEVQFLDIYHFYESVFDRIPVDELRYEWFLENITSVPHSLYDSVKRFTDILLASIVFIITLPLYLFVWLLLLSGEGKGLFSFQERMGKFGKPVRLIKFRTMIFDDNGKWKDTNLKNKVTKSGEFLRKFRIDEIPQLINVIKGDISLIGPRPEFFKAIEEYQDKIPYYNMRHIIKPGLSGWAQIYHENHPHHGIDVEETKNKLSYDLFYVKNRSFALDLVIALKTIKTLLSRQGK